MEKETQITWDDIEYIQHILFPINNNKNVFIYPSSLKYKLPQKVINIIQPSLKYIPQYSISKLTKLKMMDPITNTSYNYLPNMHLPTIFQLLSQPLSALSTSECTLKNHFVANEFLSEFREYLYNDYKYGEPLKIFQNNYQHNTTNNNDNNQTNDQNNYKTNNDTNNDANNNNDNNNTHYDIYNYNVCNIKTLRKYEEKYDIKYILIDKLLGIAIVGRELLTKLCNDEINKILILISYDHNPALIRDKATEFAHKYQHTLHPKNRSPNQSFIDLLDDIHHTTNGYFIWNPIYKAHKYDANGNHIPKIRPVIAGNKSPLKPILRMIADGCNIIIHALQNMFNIINIVQDSFQVIDIIDNYIKSDFNPNDIIITFDLVSFYTELKIDFLNDKMDFIYNVFKDKYNNKSDYKFKSYMHIILMIKEGYKISSKYCIIKIDNKFYVQKQGVIMGASFAPSFANLSILIHIIQTKIYNCRAIKLNLRMVDDTILILKNNSNMNIDDIFKQFYPQSLEYTSERMKNNTIKFLDILFIKLNNTLHYIMQIKPLKIEFFVPYTSNHPKHIKINIVKNMVIRAVILCSNDNLFYHTFIALRIRFQRSGYPDSFLCKYMDINAYKRRISILSILNNRRKYKLNTILNSTKIKYNPKWIPGDEKRYISIIYDKILVNNQIQNTFKHHFKKLYPKKRIVPKLNNSIHKLIRCKDAQYDAL